MGVSPRRVRDPEASNNTHRVTLLSRASLLEWSTRASGRPYVRLSHYRFLLRPDVVAAAAAARSPVSGTSSGLGSPIDLGER